MANADVMSLAQGSEQMAKFGVNVPPGIPVFSLDEVAGAAKKMESPDGEVRNYVFPLVYCPLKTQACTADDPWVMFIPLCTHKTPLWDATNLDSHLSLRGNPIPRLCLSSIQPMACCSTNQVARRWW